VFVPGKPFQPSVKFASNPGAWLSKASTVSSGGIHLGINYWVLNEANDQILKFLGWKTIRLKLEIFVQ
jgi:hypothetical protein